MKPSLLISTRAILFISCICLGIVGLAYIVSAYTLPSGHLRIAIIDGERLKKEAVPFEKVRTLMAEQFDQVKAEFAPYSSQLEASFESIKAEKNHAKAQKKKEAFDKKKAEVEQIFLKKQEYLRLVGDHLSDKLEKTVFEIVNELASSKSIQIVFNRTIEDKLSIFYADPVLDITSDVISEVNKRLKNIKLPTETTLQ